MLCYKNLVKNNMQQVQENINSFHYSSMSEQTLLDLIDEPSTTIDILIKIINENNVIQNHWWFGNRLVKTSKVGYIALRKYIQRLDHESYEEKYCVYLEQARDIIDDPKYTVEGVQYTDANGKELSIQDYQKQFDIKPLPNY